MSAGPTGKQPKNCYAVKNSPFWQYDIVIKGQRERGSTGCVKASEANDFVAQRRLALKAQVEAIASGAPVSRGAIALVDACQHYLDDKVAKQKAAVTYRGQIGFLLVLLGEDTQLRMIDHAMLITYRKTRQSTSMRALKESTINREIELLRRIWRYASALGYECGREPNWSAALDNGAEVERIRDLNGDEETRLMAALTDINPDLARVAEFAMITGQRKSAVITLTWSQLDLPNRRATILLKSHGAAPKPHTFPLPARAMEVISTFEPLAGSDRVFTYLCRRPAPARADRPARIKGQRYPFSQGGWARDWQRALVKANVQDFRFHDLRHTAATRIVRATGNLKVAQVLLGHSDITQTARYAHAFHDDVLDAMERSAK